MPIIIGRFKVSFLPKKTIVNSLCQTPNIGVTTTKWILSNMGLPVSATSKIRAKACRFWPAESRVSRKFRKIPKYFGKDFTKLFWMKYKKIRYSGSIKSTKLKYGLPVHGQRTHSNASTAKRRSRRKNHKKKLYFVSLFCLVVV